MAGKMRFCQKTKAGDSARVRELVPLRRSYRPEAEFRNNPLKQFAKKRTAAKRFGRASVGVNNPFDSIHNDARSYC